jgi:putative ABC transport system permease protein
MGWRPLTQAYAPGVNIQVRTAGSAAAFGATLKRLVREMNPSIPVRPYPMTEAVAAALLPQKLGVAVAGAFGLVGLLLAAVGLYGVMAYSVSQRTRELGIRTALGASANDTVRLVLRHALALMALGAVLGAAAGLGATRLLTSLLFGVSPTDPLAFLAVLTILAMVALVASLAPARRATRVDPMVALRAE